MGFQEVRCPGGLSALRRPATFNRSYHSPPHRPDLTGTDLAGTDLHGAVLVGVVLRGANLTGAKIRAREPARRRPKPGPTSAVPC